MSENTNQPTNAPQQDAFPGLDYDFLQYIGADPQVMRRIQSFYLPYYKSCNQVVDLACGGGDFVAMLHESGINVVGVDADDKAFAAAQARKLPVVHQDVFAYLRSRADASVDGIFCAHLVEHLPYPKVIELVEQSWRVLQPGGRIVLATPNVRSLFSHLEMFYLHFGHVSFYHPRLLGFFLEHAGFSDLSFGENPETASQLMPMLLGLAGCNPAQSPLKPEAVDYRRVIPLQGKSLLHKASYQIKHWLTRTLVQPITDDLARKLNAMIDQRTIGLSQRLEQIAEMQATTVAALQSVNGAFECYTTAIKPR